MWRRCRWRHGLRFSLFHQQTFFPHLDHFPEKFQSFEGSQQKFHFGAAIFFFFDHVPGERKTNSPILSRLHTILPRNEWHSSACRALKCRGTRRQAETFFFCRVCHTPQVATVCFFSEGRLINHEYLMIACSRSDRAPSLMENINVGEDRFDWGAL